MHRGLEVEVAHTLLLARSDLAARNLDGLTPLALATSATRPRRERCGSSASSCRRRSVWGSVVSHSETPSKTHETP